MIDDCQKPGWDRVGVENMEIKIVKTDPGGVTIEVEAEDNAELVDKIMKEVERLCLSDQTTQ